MAGSSQVRENGREPLQHESKFRQRNRSKSQNNRPRNGKEKQTQSQPNNYNKSHNPSVAPTDLQEASAKDAVDKSAKYQFILMVSGLPGKMDFKILKENLQLQAYEVHGKVKYVKNGQAFITFNNESNADLAVELFNGKKIFGKTLNVRFTKNIPFEEGIRN